MIGKIENHIHCPDCGKPVPVKTYDRNSGLPLCDVCKKILDVKRNADRIEYNKLHANDVPVSHWSPHDGLDSEG